MKENRHIIAGIFLIFFSFMQLVDLHAIGHDAHDADCKLCQIALEGIDDDFSTIGIVEIPKEVLVPIDTFIIDYKNQYTDSINKFSFLNKAPPAI